MQYEDGILDGYYVDYEDNSLLEQGINENNLKNGVCIIYSQNKIISMLNYENGNINGFSIDYGNDGKIEIETYLKTSMNILQFDNFFIQYSNGKVIQEGFYLYGERSGIWTFYTNTRKKEIFDFDLGSDRENFLLFKSFFNID